MPATVNLVGDNKCLVRVVKGSATGTMDNTGKMYIAFTVNGDIGDGAVISATQQLRTGDVALTTLWSSYLYDEAHDRTDIVFIGTNEPDHSGDVKVNYSIITS